ncbi:MAG: phosphate butyryltransferase [Candidatus Eremiobacteraeota bacterium]|nr:phosphate butyryltransferase [Candidatus Eremiobacteraeota bacterium]
MKGGGVMETFDDIKQAAYDLPDKNLVVAGALDEQVIIACANAYREGICNSILVGKPDPITGLCLKYDFPPGGYEILPAENSEEECLVAIEAIKSGRAQILMKGKVKTGFLMKTVLSNLGRDRLLSHVFVAQRPEGGFFLMSDGGMVIKPSIEDKLHIIENAVEVARALGISEPRVLILSHETKVQQGEEASLEGAIISTMAKRGQISTSRVYGPGPLELSIDNADIVIVPNIECGNILGKSIQYFAGFSNGLIVAGARCPIVLTSRADSAEIKLNSIALALVSSTFSPGINSPAGNEAL